MPAEISMAFSQIRMTAFRNFQSASFEPHHSMNIIIGANGSGKSSLLEAVSFLCLGKSFRTARPDSAVNSGAEEFVLFGCNDTRRIGIKRGAGTFEIVLDGEKLTRLSDLARISPARVIHPADIELLTGSPAERRSFIDWGAFYHSDDFYDHWSKFRRILKQRNAYLKMNISYDYIDALDAELVVHAEALQEARRLYVEDITDTVSRICRDFLPEYEFGFSLYSGWDQKKGLAQQLKNSYERDRMQGFTSFGPQRADLRITVDHSQVQDVLSRGQLKLLLCSLRLSQCCFHEKDCGTDCMFLLDDFASELDQSKREKLADYLFSLRGQVFITAIDESETRFFQKGSCDIFELDNNVITKR